MEMKSLRQEVEIAGQFLGWFPQNDKIPEVWLGLNDIKTEGIQY